MYISLEEASKSLTQQNKLTTEKTNKIVHCSFFHYVRNA